MIAFKNGVEYVNSHYDVRLEYEHMKCEYSDQNAQCIKERCPYYMVDMKTYQVRQRTFGYKTMQNTDVIANDLNGRTWEEF